MGIRYFFPIIPKILRKSKHKIPPKVAYSVLMHILKDINK